VTLIIMSTASRMIAAPVNTTITASFGVNKFLVTYPPQLAALYPDHVRHTSFFGRLINRDTIVNVIPSLYHDDVLMGYVVEFDLRDPGEYHLQLGVSWYNGDSEPLEDPVPECVNGFQGLNFDYRKSGEQRSFIHWGRHIVVQLTNDSAAGTSTRVPRFGSAKCTTGDSPGRWLNMGEKQCEPPYCSGNRFATVNNIDWVRSRRPVCCMGYLFIFQHPVLFVGRIPFVVSGKCGFGHLTIATTTCTPSKTCCTAVHSAALSTSTQLETVKSESSSR
jgi:hypothetical protein